MYNFDEIVDRRNTNCTKWDFTEEKLGKKDVLPFGISDMDFKSPPAILQAMQKRLEHGIFGYTIWNNDEYKNSIVNWYQKRLNYSVNKDWLVYGTNALYLFSRILELYNPKKEAVAIFLPCFNFFDKILVNNNYPINGIEIKSDLKNSNFEEQIKKSKVFVLCNPNNPCGYLWEKEELQYIIEVCKKYNVAIISDEIYMDIVYKPYVFNTILEIAENYDYLDKVSVVTSSSKTFNISGLGGGYGFLPHQEFRKKLEIISSDKEVINSGIIFGLVATIAGYNESEQWVESLLKYLYSNFELTKQFIDNNIPTLSLEIPKSTYFAWINCSNLPLANKQIQEILLHTGNIGLLDGIEHYNSNKKYLRMNIACPKATLQDGLNRLAKCFGDYKL